MIEAVYSDVLVSKTVARGGGGNSLVGKSSTSHAGDPGSNHGGGLTQVNQTVNERGRDYQL